MLVYISKIFIKVICRNIITLFHRCFTKIVQNCSGDLCGMLAISSSLVPVNLFFFFLMILSYIIQIMNGYECNGTDIFMR